jgi:phenylpyruvate tautomerase PptA (4-oxalocrotonate tautomerase family)
MPLYTVTTQAGILDAEAEATLAVEVTAFHSEYADVPKGWVHIVLQEYTPAADPCRPLAGVQARAAETPLVTASRRDRRTR